jgi:MFS family permease
MIKMEDKNTKKAFWVFSILTVLDEIDDRILFVILPYFLLAEQFSASQMGIIFSMASVILLLSKILIGKLSDVFGRKKIFSLGLLINSVSISLFPSLTKVYQFGIVKGMKEIGETLSDSVIDAIQADVFKKRVRAKILSKLGALVPSGRALATIIGFLVTAYVSLAFGFYLASLVVFFEFLIFFLFFEEKKVRVKKFEFSIKVYSKRFLLVAFIGFLISLNFTSSYFPGFFILAKEKLKITSSLLFILLFFDYLISSIFTWWSGKWIDKIGRRRVLFLGIIGIAIFTFLYPFSSNIIQFFLIMVGISVSFYIWRVAYKTVLMDLTISKYRGEQIGFSKTLQGIGNMIGPIIGGFLIDSISLSSAFFFAGFTGLLASVIAYRVKK